MVSDFLLSWSRLNLFFLLIQQQENLAKLDVSLEAVAHFKYRKTKDGY